MKSIKSYGEEIRKLKAKINDPENKDTIARIL